MAFPFGGGIGMNVSRGVIQVACAHARLLRVFVSDTILHTQQQRRRIRVPLRSGQLRQRALSRIQGSSFKEHGNGSGNS
jgi:hypothetical protein